MKLIPILYWLLLFSFTSVVGHANPFVANSSNYDVVYHRINITVDPTGGSSAITAGSVTTYFKTTIANVNSLEFDLDGAMNVSSANYHGSTITKSHNTVADILTLTLPSSIVSIGTLDSITINYSGSPILAPATGVPSGYNVVQKPNLGWCIYTLDEAYTAHNWWPCKESLYDKIDKVELTVTTPSTYKVAGNGLVTETVSGSTRTTTWITNYPTATYGVNFAVANYQNYQFPLTTYAGNKTYQVLNYFFGEDFSVANKGYADQLKTIIPAFEQILGVDYPFANEKYGLAECTAGWGALEVQSMTFMASDAYADNGYTIAHEAAHQWFGDMVTTNSWHQIWLNEGFAQYFQYVIYPEKVRPADLATKRAAIKNNVTTTSTTYVTDTTSANRIFFDPNSASVPSQPYNKGAMLISMLRTWVGDAGFFAGLKDYLTAPRISYGFGAVDSLKKYMQAYTPVDLTGFFNDWVNKQGYSNYTVQWTNVGKKIYFKLVQTPTVAGSTHFDMAVPVRITGTGLDTTVVLIDRGGVLYNSATGATSGINKISFDLSAIPSTITPDPNNVILGTGAKSVNVTLPVHTVSLQTKKNANQLMLNWKIVADERVKSIYIERSSDGAIFSSFKDITAGVWENGVSQGSCTDNLFSTTRYYRVKALDQNNKTSYSSVQTVYGNNIAKVELLSNPVSDEVVFLLPGDFAAEQVMITIRNIQGQALRQATIAGCEGSHLIVKVSELPAGMYWAEIVNKKSEFAKVSFMKQ